MQCDRVMAIRRFLSACINILSVRKEPRTCRSELCKDKPFFFCKNVISTANMRNVLRVPQRAKKINHFSIPAWCFIAGCETSAHQRNCALIITALSRNYAAGLCDRAEISHYRYVRTFYMYYHIEFSGKQKPDSKTIVLR